MTTTVQYKLTEHDKVEVLQQFPFRDGYFLSQDGWQFYSAEQMNEEAKSLERPWFPGPDLTHEYIVSFRLRLHTMSGFWKETARQFGETGVWLYLR